MLLLLACAPAASAPEPRPAPEQAAGPAVVPLEVPRALLPYPPALAEALAHREHAAAAEALAQVDPASLPGELVGDHAFVRGWTLLRAGRADEAVRLRKAVAGAEHAPAGYRDLLEGELALAEGDFQGAVEPLSRAAASGTAIVVRAQLALADARQRAGQTAEARTLLAGIVARPDPSPGSAQALWALAQRSAGADREELLRRLYRHYPLSAEDQAAPEPTLTLEDLAWRGDRLQDGGNWNTAADLLDDRLAEAPVDTAVGCVYRHAYGRAQHKRNNITDAAAVLEPLGKGCQKADPDRGARALYLAGKSYERKKEWANAARAYLAIPALYPDHSMADDGYALGGIGLQESGDLAGARRAWSTGFERYPQGDLAGETAWRLAWGARLAGDVAEARRWAERCAAEVPVAGAQTDVLGCRYWAARWQGWPDGELTTDEAARTAAVESLVRLAADHPWHYYAVLAAGRVASIDPARVPARPLPSGLEDPWLVRPAFAEAPAVRAALALVQVGLAADALAELESVEDLTGSEMAVLTGIQSAAGDFLLAHDRLRAWLKTNPPESLEHNRWKILAQAYPLQWWPEVRTAATYGWDSRVFHALVREESNFNPKIRSHAGACGLSQLMPGTASGCAKRMGLRFSSSDIWKPEVNLKIGAWYLDTLHQRYAGSTAVALSAYNAGEGNADRWLAARPDAPIDEYTESITFRETRLYVKRVSSTWQTYRTLYGDGPLYVDWSPFLVDAVP